MDGLTLATTTVTTYTSYPNTAKFFLRPSSSRVKTGSSIKRKHFRLLSRTKFIVLAAKEEEPSLNEWDQMELKFGRVIGEDPKLTLAKIMARRANPDVSFLEVEKSFHKNKGKLVDMEELQFDVPDEKKKIQSKSLDDLNLTRPVPKEGFKFQHESKSVASSQVDKQEQLVQKAVDNDAKLSVPNVILRRKPAMFVEDDENKPERSRVRIRPNLTLKMGNGEPKEKFSDMTLLRKPEPMSSNTKPEDTDNVDVKKGDHGVEMIRGRKEVDGDYSGYTLLKKPEIANRGTAESLEFGDGSNPREQLPGGDSFTAGMQPFEKTNIGITGKETTMNRNSDIDDVDSTSRYSVEAALQGKPMRQVQSVNELSTSGNQGQGPVVTGSELGFDTVNTESHGNAEELDDLPSISPLEDAYWTKAEMLFMRGDRMDVEIISSSTGGFGVSFGTLIGFLPYRNLAAKWKFFAFESWLRQKGLNPSMYKKALGVIESYDFWKKNSHLRSSIDSKGDQNSVGDIMPDMKLEDLIRKYDQQRLKFLSSFVGQKIKVHVIVADRGLRKLIVSMRPKENEESIERKRRVMANLQVGDIVKCCIEKITYFGIFVEVEGVTALIHQTEISWDASSDPASYFKVGQILEAKVHQLDFTLDRIFLSLKEITPDPLIEALESVLGGSQAEADTEWPDVESLIKELQQIEGIQSVSKGRFFFSPGLAPTFQVYMASMFENQYKLLARSGNKAQEVIVQASLDKEEMKSIILSCTNRVE